MFRTVEIYFDLNVDCQNKICLDVSIGITNLTRLVLSCVCQMWFLPNEHPFILPK